MGTKTRASGADVQLLGAFEESEGTPPDGSGGGVYTSLPFKSFSLGVEQPLGTDPLCGFGRDAADPYYDGISDTGSVEIPFDTRNIGTWLRALFGDPVTTGTGPYTHVFTAGGAVPTQALQLGHTKLTTPKYQMHNLVKAGGINFDMARSGPVNGTIDLIAQGQTDGSSPADAAPLSRELRRFSQSGGAIQADGAQLASVTAGSLSFSNSLEAVEAIRDDGLIDGIDEGEATLSGSVTVRYGVDTTLPDAANAQTPLALEISHTMPDGHALTWAIPRAFFPVKKQEVKGPTAIEATYDWQAARDPVTGHMLQVTLINDVASY